MIATDDGKLFVYGTPPNLKFGRECDVMNTHIGPITNIKRTFDNKIVATSGADGMIFVYRVSEVQNNKIGHYTKKVTEQITELERISKKRMLGDKKHTEKLSSMEASAEKAECEE